MDIQIKDESTTKLRKKGFLSSFVVIDRDMILLFRVDEGVILDNHNHPHVQLGYSFWGSFDFEVEGLHYDVTEGHSYLLKEHVYHSAVASTDYYSMDIKYHAQNNIPKEKLAQNVFVNIEVTDGFSISRTQIDDYPVVRLAFLKPNVPATITLYTTFRQYMVVSKECHLRFSNNDDTRFLEPMKIYSFSCDHETFDVMSNECVEVFFISR